MGANLVDPTIIRAASIQTCSADNITIMRGQYIEFSKIRGLIWANIRESERAKSHASLVNNVLFGLQIVKATCDVVIGVAGEWMPAASGVSSVYSVAQANTNTAGKLISGQQVTKQDIALGLSAGVNAGIKKRLGVDSELLDFSDLNKAKADLIINATAMDKKGVVESLYEYGFVLSAWSAKVAGKAALAKLIKTGDEVRKAGIAYNSAIDEWQKGDMDATFEAGLAISKRQLTTINAKIREVEQSLIACGDLKPSYQSPSTRLLSGRHAGPTIRAGR